LPKIISSKIIIFEVAERSRWGKGCVNKVPNRRRTREVRQLTGIGIQIMEARFQLHMPVLRCSLEHSQRSSFYICPEFRIRRRPGVI
jgi:hypothetical protein